MHVRAPEGPCISASPPRRWSRFSSRRGWSAAYRRNGTARRPLGGLELIVAARARRPFSRINEGSLRIAFQSPRSARARRRDRDTKGGIVCLTTACTRSGLPALPHHHTNTLLSATLATMEPRLSQMIASLLHPQPRHGRVRRWRLHDGHPGVETAVRRKLDLVVMVLSRLGLRISMEAGGRRFPDLE